MNGRDWRWKISEVIERLRSRYQHIGRKTGAPFLGMVYRPETQTAVLNEWHTQIKTLPHEFEVITIDVLNITQNIVAEISAYNIVDSLANPMPGSDPICELGHLWIRAIVDSVKNAFQKSLSGKPIVNLEHLAALYPAAGPRDIMQALWDNNQEALKGPVIVLIPGTLDGPRTYLFVDSRREFMYRGDLL
jgi:hypothetical protein